MGAPPRPLRRRAGRREPAGRARLTSPQCLIAPLSSGPRFFGVMELARRNRGAVHPARHDHRRRHRAPDRGGDRARPSGRGQPPSGPRRREHRGSRADHRREAPRDLRQPGFMRTPRHAAAGVDGARRAPDRHTSTSRSRNFQDTLQRRSWRGETTIRRRDGTRPPITAQRQPDPRRRRQGAGRRGDSRGHLRAEALPGADAARRPPRGRRRARRRHRPRDQQRARRDLRPDQTSSTRAPRRHARGARPRRRAGAPHRRHRAGCARLRAPAPRRRPCRSISRR